MILANITVLALTALAAWWLSGYDTRLTGENKREDFIRRTIRCAVTLVLVEMFFYLPFSMTAIPMLLLIIGVFAVIWLGCLSELASRGFHRLVDPEDKGKFDPHQSARQLDVVASLLKQRRNEEAVQLCEELKKSGDANVLVLEAMLARSGIQVESNRKPKPLTEAYRLRTEGKIVEAEAILNSLLAENPSNLDAALMLMRLYAQDMHRSDKAAEVLRSLQNQPHVPSAHIEYARHSIHEWSQSKPKPEVVALPESVEELLACGYFGTAIEILERKVEEQPRDFVSWMKLAETHALHFGNFSRAEKIVQQFEIKPGFSQEQIALAHTKLAHWRKAKSQSH